MSQRTAEYVYKGRKLNLALLRMQLPDGRIIIREVIEHKNIVSVLPIIDESKIVFIKQFRPVLGEWSLEIPSTTLEPGERPEHSAVRVIEELIGLKPGRVVKALEFYPLPDYSRGKVFLFIATDFKRIRLEELTRIKSNIIILNFKEAIDTINNRGIKDAKTIIAITYYYIFKHMGGLG